MLEIKGINKYFNRFKKNEIHVLNHIDLTLEETGLVALLGPSGCGKTTFLNAIGGLDSFSGSLYLNGKKISSKFMSRVDKIRNLKIGYIFQDYKLIDDKSVFDNIALVLTMLGIKDKKEIKKRVEYLLDKVGMLRYQRRPAGMLSGGERQRVGIARALAKDPEIILADEPTGNLDSKNSLEIMKIIKAISKEKLVILVTHEQNLAKFYASRIIEVQDGKVINDYLNEHNDELDYMVDNCLYLKDFSEQKKLDNVTIYSDQPISVKLDVVVKGNNVYIQSDDSYKVEVIDQYSSIEMVDDHYKKIEKKDIDAYKFDFKNIINNQYKKRYASIINPFQMIIQGFQKVMNFSFIKKILLLGFFISAMFIMYSFSTIVSCYTIHEEDFVNKNKEYLIINTKKIKVNDYLKYESNNNVNYLLPGDSTINMNLISNDYYQTSQYPMTFKGSLSSINLITDKELTSGRNISSEKEIIIDKMVANQIINGDVPSKMRGIYTEKDLLGREVSVPHLGTFNIVGVVDKKSPSIYATENIMLPLLAYSRDQYAGGDIAETNPVTTGFIDYHLYEAKIETRGGRFPTNDYEVMVNIDQKEQMPLNKKIKSKINGTELTVVGYYYSKYNEHYYLVNPNMIKYDLIANSSDITLYCQNKEKCLSDFREENLNIVDSYEDSKNDYINGNRNRVKNTLLVSSIILIISFIEIILMIRSSFLSRIKEVGIYRAIGVKRRDIYKMFFGEIFAITTLASLPGILLMSYILGKLSTISMVKNYIYMSPWLLILTIIVVYIFNFIIGLLPVYNTIRKRPAVILARYDLD